ncbi:hypothetical protein AC369_07180 [Salmonella enterica subsp. diarizonae]|nr:hypothetical protein [Salmonella enterica subsp. diarizonae]
MILDKLLMFSDEQAVTATAASTDTIDLGPIEGDTRDIGVGYPIEFFAQVSTTATATGDATVQFVLETAKTSDFANAHVLIQSAAKPVAELVSGARINAKVPAGVLRYLRVRYVVATGPLTAGSFTSGLLLDVDNQYAYPAK